MSIVISEAILARLGDATAFSVRYLDRIQVKGKKEPVSIYEVFDADPEAARRFKQEVLEDWRRAIELYYARSFEEAGRIFQAILARGPDDVPAHMYAARAEQALRDGMPEDWTGVDVLDSK